MLRNCRIPSLGLCCNPGPGFAQTLIGNSAAGCLFLLLGAIAGAMTLSPSLGNSGDGSCQSDTN